MATKHKRAGQARPSDVLKQAFSTVEKTPLMTAMKASGEYERLLRKLSPPPPPTRASSVRQPLLPS